MKNTFTSISLAIMLLTITVGLATAETYYVSPDGSDGNPGSIDQPFQTIRYAISQINGGDIIYLREGTYYPSQTIRIERASGTKDQPTSLFAYPGEQPIVDGSQFTVFDPDKGDNDILRLQAAYWHVKGLFLRNSPAGGIIVLGSTAVGNQLEQLRVYDNRDTGIDLYGGASQTLVLNCDSYRNFDSQTNGENADGFTAKFDVGPGTVFRGCRAWANSDDGWDFWKANNVVTVENCYSYDNGFDIWDFGNAFTGNGNGFKLGRDGGAHVLKNCVAWGNRVRGFDSNSNTSGVTLLNCTGWNNARNFVFYGPEKHVLRNCLSAEGTVETEGGTDDEANSWTLSVTVDSTDFQSLSDEVVTGPRGSDGKIPASDFLRLAESSDLIDQGVDVGLPFRGNAPDLGAFEAVLASEPTASGGVGKTEAEAMDLQNYEVANRGVASNRQIVQAISLQQGTSASYRFTGEDGNYDLAIRYLDEADGRSTFTLVTNDVTTRQWSADEVSEAPDQWKTFTASNISLRKDSRIEIQAGPDRGEFARLDYVTVTTVGESDRTNSPASVENRVNTRGFPSVFQAWNPIDNLDEDPESLIARHDLMWHGPSFFRLEYNSPYRGLADGVTPASVQEGLAYRQELLEKNGNLVLVAEIRYRDAPQSYLPGTDHPWWLRDDDGNLIYGWEEGGFIRLDLNNPDFQDKLAAEAKAIVESGVVDGILLDWWTENEFVEGRLALLEKIRSAIGEEALIIVNANDRQVPRSAPYVNGLFMEVGSSTAADDWERYRANLKWAEDNLREPQVNCLETWYVNSRDDLSMMRATTTLSMTASDGYTLFADPNPLATPDHLHDWYSFWDTDLGTPVEEGYLRDDGAYQRAFTQGVAVYNPPGNAPVTITFDRPMRSAATDNLSETHTIQALDGDIFTGETNASPDKTVTVRARATTGQEMMELRINNQPVATWNVTTEWAEYTFEGRVTGSVAVAFTNDGYDEALGDRNVRVDKVTMVSAVYQAEAQAVNTGAWDGTCGAGSNTEWLHCNGYIALNEPADPSLTGNTRERALPMPASDKSPTIYPNPVVDGWTTVTLPVADNAPVDYLEVVDSQGRPVLRQSTRGASSIEIDLQQLPRGVYSLRAVGQKTIGVGKVVIP